MSNVTHLRAPERCGLCGDEPASIYAELDIVVRYRDDADNRYRSQLKVCIGCSDWLTLSREDIDTQPPPPPVPMRHDVGDKCVDCGEPGQLLTSTGLRCARCALR